MRGAPRAFREWVPAKSKISWGQDGDGRGAAQLIEAVEELDSAGLAAVLAAEPRLVLVEFESRGCEPCRQLRPQLQALAAESEDVCRVVALDVDRAPDAAKEYGVRSTPTLVFFKAGRELHRLRAGAIPPSVKDLLG